MDVVKAGKDLGHQDMCGRTSAVGGGEGELGEGEEGFQRHVSGEVRK